MSATTYKLGRDIELGDIIEFLGHHHRVATVEPYDFHGSCGIARAADGWGITLFPHQPVPVA